MYTLFPKGQPNLPAALLTVFACFLPLSASAALLATMEATGDIQGPITNESTVSGREGLVEVVEFGHSLSQPIDNTTGLPAGNRQHRSVRLIKAVDLATPKLLNAMINGERLSTVFFRFYRPGNAGQEEQYYTVQLVNAYVVNVSQNSRTYDGNDWNAVVNAPPNETVTISYERILWVYEDGGVTAEDTWSSGTP